LRLTTKQQRALQLIEWMINPKWKHDTVPEQNMIREDPSAVSAEQAFFDKSERGIQHTVVSNKKRYLDLLYGHRWLAAHVKMWKEGINEGSCLVQDFIFEPLYIREFILREVFVFPIDWYEQYIMRVLRSYYD
jgi:hypothetical protein